MSATKVQAAFIGLTLELGFVDGALGLYNLTNGSFFRLDLLTTNLIVGANHYTAKLWQTGHRFVSRPVSVRAIKMHAEIDWYQRLSDTGVEIPLRLVSAGQAYVDWDKYGRRTFWRAPTGFLAATDIFDMDLEQSDPDIGIERDGHVVHWWVYLDLLMKPS